MTQHTQPDVTPDPRYHIVTMAGLQESHRVLKDKARNGELVPLPVSYTATVLDGGSDVTIEMDEPPAPDTVDPPQMFARSLIGPLRAGIRVQVQHQPPAGNFIIGTVPDEDQWALPQDDDGWLPLMQTADGIEVKTATPGTRGFWHQSGPKLELTGVVTLAAAPTGNGNMQISLPGMFKHPAADPNFDVSLMPCGQGYIVHGTAGREGIVLRYATSPAWLEMVVTPFTSGAGSTVVDRNTPWAWATGDQLWLDARVILPPPP